MAQTTTPHAGAQIAVSTPPRARLAVPRWAPYALLTLAAFGVYSLAFYGRGLDVPDEGLLLHVAERLAGGQVPYRDVYFIYTPGFQYLLAVHVALVLVVYALAARLAWRPLAVAAALVVIAGGVSPYRTLAGLLTVLALTHYAESERRAGLLVSGLLVGASYLVGQEIGLYTLGAALGCLGVTWLVRSPLAVTPLLGRAALVLAGAAAGVLPWVVLSAVQGALPAMLDDTLRVTFFHQPRYMHVPLPPLLPLVPDDLATNVVWGPPPYLFYVKLMLYLPLATIAAAAGVLGARLLCHRDDRRTRQALPLALFGALALGTLAFRADYYHLRQVLPVTLVLLAWLLTQARSALLESHWPRWAAACSLLPLAVILAVNLGEAAAQRAQLSAPLATARGTVLVDATTARDLGGLLRDLAARTAPGEAIYVAPAETAIYFLADRPNPFRFDDPATTETEVLRERDGARQRALTAALDAADVRWVVTANLDNVDGVPFADYAPLIAGYLEENFEPAARYGYW